MESLFGLELTQDMTDRAAEASCSQTAVYIVTASAGCNVEPTSCTGKLGQQRLGTCDNAHYAYARKIYSSVQSHLPSMASASAHDMHTKLQSG